MKMRPSVSLQITKTKHIICKAHINGVACQLLVDTGASSSCIHSKLQEQFKLRSKGDPFGAAGAIKGKMEVIMTGKSKIKLGRYEAGKLSFVLLDLTHINQTLSSQGSLPIEGIIGADFLKKNKVIIDYRSRKLWL
ncbi:retroviral-like aspartic protease family protein [Flavobacteriaceae bacterium]|nr:retroviral-like aspartic protease family protein [Flavobacteriaceae bacterium]